MIKKLINSSRFTSYRQKILDKIYSDISSGVTRFCCHVKFNGGSFICWKDLKEVRETLQTTQTLRYDIGEYIKSNPSCSLVWFDDTEQRLTFLKECLGKFNENKQMDNLVL